MKTVTSSFRPTLAAAQPTDWRSGINAGVPQDFQDNLSTTAEYLHQVVIREFKQEDNVNIQETTTYTVGFEGFGSWRNPGRLLRHPDQRGQKVLFNGDCRPEA